MTDVTENQPYHLLQFTLIENGEWHDARNDKGNIIVFLNDFEAIDYSRSDQFKEKIRQIRHTCKGDKKFKF